MARIILKNDDKETISWKQSSKVHFNDTVVVGDNTLLMVINEGQRFPVSVGERTLGSILSENKVQQRFLGSFQRLDASLYGIKMNTLFQGFWGLSMVNDLAPQGAEVKIRARGDIHYEVRSFDNLFDYFKLTTKDSLSVTEVNEAIRDPLQEVIKKEIYQLLHTKGVASFTKEQTSIVPSIIEAANSKFVKMGIRIVKCLVIELKKVASV